MNTISVTELHTEYLSKSSKIIDVRSSQEFDVRHIDGAINIPVAMAIAQPDDFKHDGPVYVICQSGNRSARVCNELAAKGLLHLVNVEGGMSAWITAQFATVSPQSLNPLAILRRGLEISVILIIVLTILYLIVT